MLQKLNKVLSVLVTAGLQLHKTKCAFVMLQVEYLGHILIDQYYLHPNKEQVKTIKEDLSHVM